MNLYAYTCLPTPVFNRKDLTRVFGGESGGLLLDEKGLLKSLETIIFNDEIVEIVDESLDQGHIVYQIKYKGYPTTNPLYVDSRCIGFTKQKRGEKHSKIKKEEVIKKLWSLEGYPYVWGGNYSKGVMEIKHWYPPRRILTPLEMINWCFEGVDCSGLLYEAAEGKTPRNTTELLSWGDGVELEGRSLREIARKVRPLDTFVWKGHVVISIDQDYVLESRAHQGGVFKTPLLERLEKILEVEKKKPSNSPHAPDCFVLRRGLWD